MATAEERAADTLPDWLKGEAQRLREQGSTPAFVDLTKEFPPPPPGESARTLRCARASPPPLPPPPPLQCRLPVAVSGDVAAEYHAVHRMIS